MKILLFFICFFALCAPIFAQQFYIRLDDASGFNTDLYQDSLEAATERLVAAFPDSTYRDSFKVFDFGFYLHQEVTEGGYPEAFQQKIAEVSEISPYYLLFGKQTDKTGIYTKFWVQLKLPKSNYFHCFDTNDMEKLSLSVELNIDNTYAIPAYQRSPIHYHQAEISGMEKLRAELLKLKTCCDQNGSNNCDPSCLTPEEIKLFFLNKGFDMIPITILGNAAKPSNTSNRGGGGGNVEDHAHKSIRLNEVEYPNFGVTIGNIMSCYGDSSVRAVIWDNTWFCTADVNEINNALENKKIVLTLHIWKDPLSVNDVLFVKVVSPEKLGVLPFKGHFPKKLNNEKIQISLTYIKSTIESIYAKNNFSLSSLDFNEPVSLETMDVYNEIRDHSVLETAGTSYAQDHHKSQKINFVNYKIVTTGCTNLVKTPEHLNYIFGVIIAHEFLHQIMDKSFDFIGVLGTSNIYNSFDGHCLSDRNLMFPGDGIFDGAQLEFDLTEEEIKAIALHLGRFCTLFATKHFYPGQNLPSTNPWERVPSSFKYVISFGFLLYEVERNFGKNSSEIIAVKAIMNPKFARFDPRSYEIRN